MKANLLTLIFLFAGLMVIRSSGQVNPECPGGEDFSPCSCWKGKVECISLEVAEVRSVFDRTSTLDIPRLRLELAPSDDVIPVDFTRLKRVEKVMLNCPAAIDSTSSTKLLKVEPSAFRSSAGQTQELQIFNCDLSQLDFTFLQGFDQLSTIGLESCRNLHQSLPTLPALKSLTKLSFELSSGLNEWTVMPRLVNGLKYFELRDLPELQDPTVERILDWLMGSSRETLQELNLSQIGITKVPRQIASFSRLSELHLAGNRFNRLATSSLIFYYPPRNLNLFHSGITAIETGAFQGNFGSTGLVLEGNQLTRLEESVFLPILQQMSTSGLGTITLAGNPFDCVEDICYLKWLVLDNPHLLDHVVMARCSNGTEIRYLKTNAFYSCSSPVNTADDAAYSTD